MTDPAPVLDVAMIRDRVTTVLFSTFENKLRDQSTPRDRQAWTLMHDTVKLHMVMLYAELDQVLKSTVQTGVFAGMRYVSERLDLSAGARLLGTYELEIQPLLARLPAAGYQMVVNAGAGEGYYAVGLARLLKDAQIHAYEIDEKYHEGCRRLAAWNGVGDRVHVRGAFDIAVLDALAGSRVLLFCDIEGGEFPLLDPARHPVLRDVDMIVEVHSGRDEAKLQAFVDRFAATHAVTVFRTGDRVLRPDTVFDTIGGLNFNLMTCEWRGEPTPWVYLQARAP